MKSQTKYIGKWRILEMEQWDKDFIDLVGEGHITFEKKNRGQLHFGAQEVRPLADGLFSCLNPGLLTFCLHLPFLPISRFIRG